MILKNSELEYEKTINNANLKAESVLHKAELETKKIINDSKEEVLKIKKEFESLTALKDKFFNDLKSLSDLTKDALNKFNNDFKFNYDNRSQSFTMSFDWVINLNTTKCVKIPITCRTRAAGGWSGKSLFITTSGLKIT